jgi:hypothetical protein
MTNIFKIKKEKLIDRVLDRVENFFDDNPNALANIFKGVNPKDYVNPRHYSNDRADAITPEELKYEQKRFVINALRVNIENAIENDDKNLSETNFGLRLLVHHNLKGKILLPYSLEGESISFTVGNFKNPETGIMQPTNFAKLPNDLIKSISDDKLKNAGNAIAFGNNDNTIPTYFLGDQVAKVSREFY